MVHVPDTLTDRARIYELDAAGGALLLPGTGCTLTCVEARDLALQELPDAVSDGIAAALSRASQPADDTTAGWVAL